MRSLAFASGLPLNLRSDSGVLHRKFTSSAPVAVLSNTSKLRALPPLPENISSKPAPAPARAPATPLSSTSHHHLHPHLALARAHIAKHAALLKPLTRLENLTAAVRSFRSKNAKQLRLARIAVAAVFGIFALCTLRGPAAFATAGAGAAAATAAAPAVPSGLLAMLPEGMVRVFRPFTESFGVVFLSEFGDKSMFATALMAMKYSPFLVLIGALLALTLMTLIACFLGQMMHLLPAYVTHYSTIALFVFFGAQMLLSARSLPAVPGGVGGERADAEALVADSALARSRSQSALSVLAKISSLIFVAEWCDRSMIATMALAANGNTLAVVGGATLANVLCTGMAVGAAALVASRISERTVAIIAGLLFEVFAVITFFEGPEA